MIQQLIFMNRLVLLLIGLVIRQLNAAENVYKTHYIHWNISNPIFLTPDYQLIVNPDDEIVFVCPQDTGSSFEVRFTYDHTSYVMCDFWSSTHLVVCDNLHRTVSDNPWYRFIVTDFQFIPGNPEFKLDKPVYFLARHFYCYQNMKVQIVMMPRGQTRREQTLPIGNNYLPQQDGDVTPSANQASEPSSERVAQMKYAQTTSNGSWPSLATLTIQYSLMYSIIGHILISSTNS